MREESGKKARVVKHVRLRMYKFETGSNEMRVVTERRIEISGSPVSRKTQADIFCLPRKSKKTFDRRPTYCGQYSVDENKRKGLN